MLLYIKYQINQTMFSSISLAVLNSDERVEILLLRSVDKSSSFF